MKNHDAIFEVRVWDLWIENLSVYMIVEYFDHPTRHKSIFLIERKLNVNKKN